MDFSSFTVKESHKQLFEEHVRRNADPYERSILDAAAMIGFLLDNNMPVRMTDIVKEFLLTPSAAYSVLATVEKFHPKGEEFIDFVMKGGTNVAGYR